jgi:hypothetical protein
MKNQLDSPWKDVLDKYFHAFMELMFPDAYAEIDWDRGYEVLDTELQKIVRDAELGKRLADKLVKVVRRDGDELLVLVHTEIQDQYDKDFAGRMFTYHYRIRDRYNRPVVSLAVLGDEDQKWRPSRYAYGLWGCVLEFKFPVVKLTDFGTRWEWLENSDNPFATVVMTHLKALETMQDDIDRKHWKMRLTRNMYERGFTKQTILDIFHIIDWMLGLPEELENQFEAELESYEKERKMPYMTTIERKGLKKGLRQGMEQGMEQGMQQGMQRGMQRGMEQGMEQGMQRGECKTLLRILSHRFGDVSLDVRQRVESAGIEQLEAWIDAALDAETVNDVFHD